MKGFLCITCLGVAGLGFLSSQAAKVSHEITKDEPEGSLELGLRAITGQLTIERLRDLEGQLRQVNAVEPRCPKPMPSLPLTPPRPVNALERPPLSILEAWGDESGRIFVRLTSGETFQRLDSGALVPIIQRSNDDSLATPSPVQ